MLTLSTNKISKLIAKKRANATRIVLGTFSLLTILTTTHSFAQDSNTKSVTIHPVVGNCVVVSAASGNPGRFSLNGDFIVNSNQNGKTNISCGINSLNPRYGGFERLVLSINDRRLFNFKYGKLRFHLRFTDAFGRYKGAVYAYADKNEDTQMVIRKPDWATQFDKIMLNCDLGPADVMHGYTIIASQNGA